MLTPQQIAELAADLETFRVERKASLSDKSGVEEAICAFANDLPGAGQTGIILIGVTDRTGQPTGLPVTDELLRNLTDIRSSGNILPFPVMRVYKATLADREIAVVEVEPSHDPPVRLRGRVCVRVGPRKGTATRDEERVLNERRRGWDGPFDQRPVHGTSVDDLDLTLFTREYLPSAVTRRSCERTAAPPPSSSPRSTSPRRTPSPTSPACSSSAASPPLTSRGPTCSSSASTARR